MTYLILLCGNRPTRALQFVVYFKQKGLSVLLFYEHTNDQIRIPGALPRN